MEKQDLKTIEKELSEIKLYTMIQSKLQKEMLIEIKQLRREYGHFRRESTREHSKRESD